MTGDIRSIARGNSDSLTASGSRAVSAPAEVRGVDEIRQPVSAWVDLGNERRAT